LGGHENVTMNELIAIIEQKLGRKANVIHHPFPAADMTANLADVTKAGQLLGWEAQVGLEEGIERTIAWYNAEREWTGKIDVG
jgi:UDP-glucuronate 4-epimerase